MIEAGKPFNPKKFEILIQKIANPKLNKKKIYVII